MCLLFNNQAVTRISALPVCNIGIYQDIFTIIFSKFLCKFRFWINIMQYLYKLG